MVDHNIRVKNSGVLRALLEHRYHPVLTDILCWLAETHGLCITEGFRPKRHKNDLHGQNPVRAGDLRSWFYKPTEAIQIEKEINERWEYDPKRPAKVVAWIHESFDENGKSMGVHFHIQVHPRTRRRETETYGEVM